MVVGDLGFAEAYNQSWDAPSGFVEAYNQSWEILQVLERHIISHGMLLQVLQRHIISPGRSFRFCKEIIPKIYLVDDLNTYMEARPTSSMKKGWNCRKF